MKKIFVQPSTLEGHIKLPSSKSQTLRALIFAMMAEGLSTIDNILISPDTEAMLSIMRSLGAKVVQNGQKVLVEGVGGNIKMPSMTLNVQNSGIILRFISALLSLQSCSSIITGDYSIKNYRSMSSLKEALALLGVQIHCLENPGFAPLKIKGPLTRYQTTVNGQDSQFVSALLILGAFSKQPLEIFVKNPGERPWVFLTLKWLDFLGIAYQKAEDFSYFKVFGQKSISGFSYVVPSDLSSASFPIAAALITNSTLTLTHIDLNDPQGDKKLITILQSMGAFFHHDPKKKTLTILKGSFLKGKSIDINDCIDSICIMAVIGCFAEGRTVLYNAEVAKTKECNRIEAMQKELKKMGAHITACPDGLVIEKSQLHGAQVSGYDDHRVILSLAVAGLNALGTTCIEKTEAISKTYAPFVFDMQKVNACIEEKKFI